MQIRLDPHTLERAKERGTDRREIEVVIKEGKEGKAKGNR